jgi:hypothetical protein
MPHWAGAASILTKFLPNRVAGPDRINRRITFDRPEIGEGILVCVHEHTA